MKKIYCLSGLGADERIFRKLDVKNAELVYIPWPEHDEHDELPCYAQKVSALIKEEDPFIMGVSLGGMIGVEITKLRPVKKLIVISSAKTRQELPTSDGWLWKIVKSGIIPSFVYKIPNSILFEKLGAESDEDEALLEAMMKDADAKFLKWAMKAVANWQNDRYLEPTIHIHGWNDKTIDPQNINAQYWIEDGGHMLVYNRAVQVNEIVQKELDMV